jgi:CheY-like chemotaxis protein
MPRFVDSDADGRALDGRPALLSKPRLNLTGVNILIVEDTPDGLELLRQMVGAFGANVLTARDGREAQDVVSGAAPDLILLDLLMPRLNGFQFMDWLRRHAHLSWIPVVAVTALGTQVDVMRTWAAGFSAHLTKPLDFATVEALLERFFSASRETKRG